MSAHLTESLVEETTAAQLVATHYECRRGTDIDDTGERTEAGHVLLPGRIAAAVQRLNPLLPAAEVQQVIRSLSAPPHAALIENNRWFHTLLTDGVEVEYRDPQTREIRGGRARLIDFDDQANNDYLVVRQLPIRGANDNSSAPISSFMSTVCRWP